MNKIIFFSLIILCNTFCEENNEIVNEDVNKIINQKEEAAEDETRVYTASNDANVYAYGTSINPSNYLLPLLAISNTNSDDPFDTYEIGNPNSTTTISLIETTEEYDAIINGRHYVAIISYINSATPVKNMIDAYYQAATSLPHVNFKRAIAVDSISITLKVFQVPTLVLYVDGVVVAKLPGTYNPDELIELIRQNLNPIG